MRDKHPIAAKQTGHDIASMSGEAVTLLCGLIRIPSFSREEGDTAAFLASWFAARGMNAKRSGNNLWLRTPGYDPAKPSLLLCSHHDTVRPVGTWTRDPFSPECDDARITGLGSNDAGASAAAMSVVYAAMQERKDLPFNLLLALTAEEEIAGDGGIVSILDALGPIDLTIVGEPTGMELAVAEKGLLVLDCTARGVAGHAARSTGTNAITRAMQDISWFNAYRFDRESPALGPVCMTVTQIAAGTQHNVVPDRCDFVVDVRVTDSYSHEEILETVRQHVASEVTPRSMRLRPSAVPADHPVVIAATQLGIPRFGSPTMSDQALLSVPSVKIGPGRSERSHTADEYVMVEELEQGLLTYMDLLEQYAELTA